ncbi:MAG: amidohydrolase family protein [Planctomycetota bacterium]
MAHKIVVFLIALCSIFAGRAFAQDLVIVGGRLFDSISDELRPNTGIIVRGGKIAVVDAEEIPAEIETRLTLPDAYTVMPGIFDLHAHFNVTVLGAPRQDVTEHYAAIMLANGVTSAFPGGEYNPDDMLAMRRRIDRGEQAGPRVYSSGPYYGQFMRRDAGKREVYERVDTWAANGARAFKAKGINPTQLEALIERAHLHGLTVTGHLGSGFRNSVNPKDAILMGIDRVEHFLGGDLLPPTRSAYASLQDLTDEDLDSEAFREIVDLFIDRGVFFDATLTAYGYFGADDDVYDRWHDESRYFTDEVRQWMRGRPERREIEQFKKIYEVKKKTLKRFADAGGLITLGTDHVSWGTYLGGFAVHREMHAMVKAGLDESHVLKIATINGARALNVSNKLGTIEPGKLADMIVITGDPTEDITATRTVSIVVKSGVVFDSADLLESAAGKLEPKYRPARGD